MGWTNGQVMSTSKLQGRWTDFLLSSQMEIASYGHPHYLADYRAQESFYWSFIPGWMAEDWRDNPPNRVLDIGCAYGTLLLYARRLTQCDVYGVDFISEYANQELFAKWLMHWAKCNIELEDLPWDVKFDAVIMTEVLEHFNFQPSPTLARIAQMLEPKGVVYLSTPDSDYCGRITHHYNSLAELPMPNRRTAIIDDHVWHYNKAEVETILWGAGLRIVRFDRAPGVHRYHINLAAVRK